MSPSWREAVSSSWRRNYEGDYCLDCFISCRNDLNNIYYWIVYDYLPVEIKIKLGNTK